MQQRPGRPAPYPPPQRDNAPFAFGCAGALLAFLIVGGLGSAVLLAPVLRTLPAAPAPDPTQADMVIDLQEAFLTDKMVTMVPANSEAEILADVQPNNRLIVNVAAPVSLFGQESTVNVSIGVVITAVDCRLHVDTGSVTMQGQEVGPVVEALLGGLGDSIDQAIQEQVAAGLGADACIMNVTTDDERMLIMARWSQ